VKKVTKNLDRYRARLERERAAVEEAAQRVSADGRADSDGGLDAAEAMNRRMSHMRHGEDVVLRIPLDHIRVDAERRACFADETVRNLAADIRRHGLYHPIMVRPLPGRPGHYELVQGKRRLLAWRLLREQEGAQWDSIPATVRVLTDLQKQVVRLAENLQRRDVRPLKDAEALRGIRDIYEREHGETLTVRQLGALVGKSKDWVARRLALLEKPEDVQRAVIDGRMSLEEAAHGKTNSAAPASTEEEQGASPRRRPPMARIDARVLERVVRKMADVAAAYQLPPIGLPPNPERNDYVVAIETRLEEILDAAHRRAHGD